MSRDVVESTWLRQRTGDVINWPASLKHRVVSFGHFSHETRSAKLPLWRRKAFVKLVHFSKDSALYRSDILTVPTTAGMCSVKPSLTLSSTLFKNHCTWPLWYPDHPHHCGRFAFTVECPFQKTLNLTALVSWPSPPLWALCLHCRVPFSKDIALYHCGILTIPTTVGALPSLSSALFKRHCTWPLWYPDHPHHYGRSAFTVTTCGFCSHRSPQRW